MINIEAVSLSVAGNICVLLLNISEVGKIPKIERPDFKEILYWLPFIVHPLISCIIAYAYFDEKEHVNRMLAIQIGASSQLIFKNLANGLPIRILSKRD